VCVPHGSAVAVAPKNAQNSTGPRSELGRRHSRRNALRHGLAVAIGSDPSFSNDIDALVTMLGSGARRPIVREFARQVAEAQIDLLRIRKLKAARASMQFSATQKRSSRTIPNSIRCSHKLGVTSDERFNGAS
jgi:hypothetical protein